jgi:hypothetical protein
MSFGSNSTHAARRIALLALAAVALAAAASALAGARAALAAAPATCPRGDFCIWDNSGYRGGVFREAGPSASLFQERFLGGSRAVVANNNRSWFNNGYRGAYEDVLIYMYGFYMGSVETHACVPNGVGDPGQGEDSDPKFVKKMESYRWVNSC